MNHTRSEVSCVAAALWLLLATGLSGCGKAPPPGLSGYVEADYVRVAAPLAGRLVKLEVARGDAVRPAQPLFTLEQDNENAAVEAAAAGVVRAQAQAADLAKGRRKDEIDALNATRDAAQAALRQSEAEYRRQVQLAKEGFVSGADLDTLKAKRDEDEARLREAQAQLRLAQLGARADQRAAAQAETQAAKAELASSRWQLAQKSVVAANAARVEDTLFRVGEWVPAGSPVVSLLEPAGVKVRFFVMQAQLPALKVGDAVSVVCDGCPAPVPAKVSFIANQAEYTPPVIYSREQRSKLVFLVEARPNAADAAKLHPGQPVEVTLPGKAS